MLKGIEIGTINHLGIVAGIIDELDIVDIVNQELGIEEQEIVNSGEIVKAIILNGLGFVSQPLYLFPKFFEDKATSHLLGNGILPEHLNEHKIGRVMDKLYDFGLSELFLLIALAAAKKNSSGKINWNEDLNIVNSLLLEKLAKLSLRVYAFSNNMKNCSS